MLRWERVWWWMQRRPSPAHRALRLRQGTVVDAMGGLDLRGQQVRLAGPRGMVSAAKAAAVASGAKPARIQHDPMRA